MIALTCPTHWIDDLVDLSQLPIDKLWVRTREDETAPWTNVPTTYDATTGTLQFDTTHFSTYQVGAVAEPWEMTYTPPGVSAYTGAANYSYAIPLPPGIGGLAPSLTLAYSSRGVDGMRFPVMTSGLGAGWSMTQVEIINGNATRMYEDQYGGCGCHNFDNTLFTLVLNGATYRLQPFSGVGRYGRYTATGDPSLYIEYRADAPNNVTGEYWIVRTADGTTFRFGYNEDAEQVVAPMSVHNIGQIRNPGFAVASWKLDSVTDLHNRQVRYTYGTGCGWHFVQADGCRRFSTSTHIPESYTFGSPPPAQPTRKFRTEADVVVAKIEYNFVNNVPKTEVSFTYSSRNWEPVRTSAYMIAGHYRPERILVKHANQIINAYDFTYIEHSHRQTAMDVSTQFWQLTSITPYGLGFDPSTGTGPQMPVQTFAYEQNATGCGDNINGVNHCVALLTKVENGYGATTRFVYSRWGGSKWFHVTDVYTWDGVEHVYNGNNNAAATRIHYSRTGYTACYDKDGHGCRTPSATASEALVGFSGVTINVQSPNGSGGWTTKSRQEQKFRIDNYWLNGKNTESSQLDPTNNAVMTKEVLTWALSGRDARLTQRDNYVYDGSISLHTYETYSYYDGTGHYGGLRRTTEYDEYNTVYRCVEQKYTHQTDGNIWLVNRPLRQTMYAGNCGSNKETETLYRYDGSVSPTDNNLNGKGQLEWTLSWDGVNYISEHREYYPTGSAQAGLLRKVETFNDYSTTSAYATDVRQIVEIMSYSNIGLPLSTETSGSNILTQSQTLTYNNSLPWLINSVTDANNLTTNYTYDSFGRLQSVINPGDTVASPSVRYVYSDAESPWFLSPMLMETYYKDGLLQNVRQFYDGFGRLVQEQNKNFAVDGVGLQDIITTYSYDALGNLDCQTVPYPVTPYVWNGNSPFHTESCFSKPHTTTTYDTLGRPTLVTAPDGNSTRYYYATKDKNALNASITNDYNDVPDYRDGSASMPDGPYNVISSVDANNHAMTQIYNAKGEMVYVTEYEGTSYPWTKYATTTYGYDLSGNLARVIDAVGNMTTINYDALGRKTSMADPDMGQWQYEYDTAGNLTRQEDNNDQVICFYYDGLNRLERKTSLNSANEACPISKDLAPTSGANHLASYVYDEAANGIGQISTVRWGPAPQHNYDAFTYDSLGRMKKQTRILDGRPYTMETLAFDALNRPLRVRYPNNEIVVMIYDHEGENNLIAGSNTLVKNVSYNARSQITQLNLGNLVATTFDYANADGNYRLDTLSHISALGGTTTSEETIGEVGVINDTLTHTPQTIVLQRAYDNPVVFVQPVSLDGSDTSVVRITNVQSDRFTLDVHEPPNQDGAHTSEAVSYLVLEAGSWSLPDGTLLEVGTTRTNATVEAAEETWETIVFAQDFASSPVTMSQVQSNNDSHWFKTRQHNISAAGFNVVLEEDEVQTTFHDSETIGWLAIEAGQGTWNGHLYEATQTDAITHDWYQINFSQSFTQPPHFIGGLSSRDGADPGDLRYDRTSLTSSGVSVKIEEDTTPDSKTEHTTEQADFLAIQGDGLLTALVQVINPLLFQTSYSYDAVGNIISITDNMGDDQTFGYDDLNRLVTASTPVPFNVSAYDVTYAYDAIGNIDYWRDNLTGTVHNYNYGSKPHAVTSITGGQVFSYDLNGNMVARHDSSGVYMQNFDVENRLTRVQINSDSSTTTFDYDASGQRTITEKPDGTIVYTPFPNYEEELRGETTTQRVTYSLAGQAIAVRVTSSATLPLAAIGTTGVVIQLQIGATLGTNIMMILVSFI